MLIITVILCCLAFPSKYTPARAHALCPLIRAQIRLLYLMHNTVPAPGLSPDRFGSFLRRSGPRVDAESAQRLFAAADADCDGSVSPAEFDAFCFRNPVSGPLHGPLCRRSRLCGSALARARRVLAPAAWTGQRDCTVT